MYRRLWQRGEVFRQQEASRRARPLRPQAPDQEGFWKVEQFPSSLQAVRASESACRHLGSRVSAGRHPKMSIGNEGIGIRRLYDHGHFHIL